MDSCEAFEPVGVQTYAAKVKRLVSAEDVLSQDELTRLQRDPSQLAALIGTWIDDPRSDAKLLRFFAWAFQQEGFVAQDLYAQWGQGATAKGRVPELGESATYHLQRNFTESFARTALSSVRSRAPFNELAKTERFMMTTAMMVALAFHDDRVLDDKGHVSYRTLSERIPVVRYTDVAVPRAQTLDPNSANFMRFTMPEKGTIPTCAGTDARVDGANKYYEPPLVALAAIFGWYPRVTMTADCVRTAQLAGDAWLPASAFEDWRLVSVRKPAPGEPTTSFYALDELQAATELVVETPRVGFFSTPAFFATWPTNVDNSARVTLNQTLITALGISLDNGDVPLPVDEQMSLADAHAAPGTSCYACHVVLDPMRNFFRREFSVRGSVQNDAQARLQVASFALGGVTAQGTTLSDLGAALATHPMFAPAWVQKLCFYATSAACPKEDAEFLRIAERFARGYDFRQLVIETLSSPLVTGAKCIAGGSGHAASTARLRHFCGTLSARTGLADVCGTNTPVGKNQLLYQKSNLALTSTIPDDNFTRSSAAPLMISDVNLFVNGAYERICEEVGKQAVAPAGVFDSNQPQDALVKMTERLMGLPAADTRHESALQILREHYAEAATLAAPELALESTFSLACLSPSVTGVGL